MKKAAGKSAVRWNCVVLAVLFFFLASAAMTLYGMQLDNGFVDGNAAKQDALVSGLYDACVNEAFADELSAYFESDGRTAIECPPQFLPEKTNFRFCATDADGNVICKNTAQENVQFTQSRTITVRYTDSENHMLQSAAVTVECSLLDPLRAAGLFSYVFPVAQVGTAQGTTLWWTGAVLLGATLFFCVLALLSALREAKRSRGAERLFNALPPDLYLCCVLPAFVFFFTLLFSDIRDGDILQNYLRTGSGDYLFLLRAACKTGVFLLLLIFLMLLFYSVRRGGLRNVFSFSRFVGTPFPRRMLVYLVVIQTVKEISIALYLTKHTQWVVLFLLLEKLVTLPVVYRMLRQLRTLMDTTAQFVRGDLSGTASRKSDYATLRMHGADVDSIVRRISDSADEYVQSSRFKAELITNLSHDIKTPLTSIISYAQLLQREDLSAEDRAKYLEVLQRHSGRLQKLVDDLTEVSDAASGNVPVQPTVLDLCSLVQSAAAGFEERLQKQDLTLRFRLPQDPVFITADPRLMQRVADNLMNNICKYSRSGTEVQIAVVDGKSSVAAVFRNRSASPLTLSGEALMERFVREDCSRHTDGSGLGLSIAESLMRLQGGKLWLHTEGDVFTSQILFRKS